jgi:hypothetical protein
MVKSYMNAELERVYKEVVVIYSKYNSGTWPSGTEGNLESPN